MKYRLFVVEDHPIMRQTYSVLFNDVPDLQLAGTAGSAEEALEEIPNARPDLVMVDISLPGRNGLELVEDLRKVYPGMRILVLSGHDDAHYVQESSRAGADGFITKGDFNLLLQEVRRLLQGPTS